MGVQQRDRFVGRRATRLDERDQFRDRGAVTVDGTRDERARFERSAQNAELRSRAGRR
jgi:hypothetical protein